VGEKSPPPFFLSHMAAKSDSGKIDRITSQEKKQTTRWQCFPPDHFCFVENEQNIYKAPHEKEKRKGTKKERKKKKRQKKRIK